MAKWTWICIVLGLVIGFIGLGVFLASLGDNTSQRIGDASVYQEIDSITDCSVLQDGFNVAMDNAEKRQPGDKMRDISLDYAGYINDRMITLGC